MSDLTPDFKNMTTDEIRSGISTLNTVIHDLKRMAQTEHKHFAVTWGASTLLVAGTTIIFPPAALLALTASNIINVDPMVRMTLARQALKEAEDLRHKFKIVWRARPGRAFRDVAARTARETERKKQNRKFKFPGFG
ncbi:MAG: hypothetical protein PW788_12700 [Micavibrio sp.]|nr:hypothetical protein [Micavibrio sp.]